jgi:hypothetical protein
MNRILIISFLAILSLAPSAPAQTYASTSDPAAQVASWYQAYLGRTTDPGSYIWVDQLARGASPEEVQAGIVGSDEYYNRAGGTPQAFIQALFRDALGRQPTPGEMDFWLRRWYLEQRKDIAYEVMTQNPGSGILAAPAPTVVTPPSPIIVPSRDRYYYGRYGRDWDHRRHHDDYDYRRPPYPYHR